MRCPDWLSDLSQLRSLYLNGNQLSGCVPDESRAPLINHDFIAVDANGDGDTADAGDTARLAVLHAQRAGVQR